MHKNFVMAVCVLGGFALGALTLHLRPLASPEVAPSMATKAAMTEDGTTAADADEVLYWYDPMQPQHRFDAPGKSPFMDMMLVPKYADASGDEGSVNISPRLLQNLGVRTELAVLDRIERRLRASGVVAYNERSIAVVQARVPMIIERLHVRATFDSVHARQALMSVIAPEWNAAQAEYLSLRRADSADLAPVLVAARQRLQLLGMSEAQIRAIERSGRSDLRIELLAPRSGVLTELNTREGASVAAGMSLATINGVESVWVNAAVPEADAGLAQRGARATASVIAYPGRKFVGEVQTLLPQVEPMSRTLTARIQIDNADGALVAGMFATLELTPTEPSPRCVLVPTEAVIATGTRHVVLVAEGAGKFRAQEVRVGIEADGRSEILEGIEAGDAVVLSGQFLIDSEASLSGALSRLSAADDADARP